MRHHQVVVMEMYGTIAIRSARPTVLASVSLIANHGQSQLLREHLRRYRGGDCWRHRELGRKIYHVHNHGPTVFQSGLPMSTQFFSRQSCR